VEQAELARALEAILFASEDGASLSQLADTCEVDEETASTALAALAERLQASSGLKLVNVKGIYRLVTRPEVAPYVERFLAQPPAKLGPAATVTLAIVAYKQPITRPEVDEIRGVNSAYLLDKLERRGLIKVVGRKDAPGRPRLYATTDLFLQSLGLESLDELPKLPALEAERAEEAEAEQLAVFPEVEAALEESSPGPGEAPRS